MFTVWIRLKNPPYVYKSMYLVVLFELLRSGKYDRENVALIQFSPYKGTADNSAKFKGHPALLSSEIS